MSVAVLTPAATSARGSQSRTELELLVRSMHRILDMAGITVTSSRPLSRTTDAQAWKRRNSADRFIEVSADFAAGEQPVVTTYGSVARLLLEKALLDHIVRHGAPHTIHIVHRPALSAV